MVRPASSSQHWHPFFESPLRDHTAVSDTSVFLRSAGKALLSVAPAVATGAWRARSQRRALPNSARQSFTACSTIQRSA